jgi:hypothetical protein
MTNNISKILENEPLFMGEFGVQSNSPASLFFGLGLCTSKKPAIAVPFDILSFFLTAESIIRQIPHLKTLILVADTHASSNNFMNSDSVQKSKQKLTNVCQKIISNLNLNNFSIVFASEISQLPSFQNVLSSIPAMENSYLRQEIADVVWLSRHENLITKLGWSLDIKSNLKGHDERFFDLEIQKFLDKPIQFIHLEAGRTFDVAKPKASPYIAVEGENRILLEADEKVSEKIGVANKDTLIHLSKIVSLFEKLFGPIDTNNVLPAKIQFIIDKIML